MARRELRTTSEIARGHLRAGLSGKLVRRAVEQYDDDITFLVGAPRWSQRLYNWGHYRQHLVIRALADRFGTWIARRRRRRMGDEKFFGDE